MIEAVRRLPSHLCERLVSALESGLLAPPYSRTALQSMLGVRANVEGIAAALSELERLGIVGAAAAAWIRNLNAATVRMPCFDLVWSGPELPGLHARDTRRVFEELFGSVERSAWVSSYALFDGPSAFRVLAQRMDARGDLDVNVVLNIHSQWGDAQAFAKQFWHKEWPGLIRPRVYYYPPALKPGKPAGVMHAKAIVVDDEAVCVTSANLTGAALDSNIELGLLVRDRALAANVVAHFRTLIDRQALLPLPPT